MRIFKVILGVILILVSINVMITMSGEEQGAGLAGTVTGFVIFVGLGAWLLYSASVKPKDTNRDEYSSVSTKESLNIKDNYGGKITLLNELRRKDILTEDEYREKAENLRKAQLEVGLKASDDYRKLKSLFDDNILTKEEFEQKLEILSKRPPIVNSTSYISEPIININNSSTKVVLGIIILIIGVFFLVRNSRSTEKNAATYNSDYNNNADYNLSDTSEVILPPIDERKFKRELPIKYYVYCSVYFQSFDAVSGANGLEPELTSEGNYCSQIVELTEDRIPKFNEKFRNQQSFSTYSGYGISVDRSTFKLKKFETYEEALKDKERNNCVIENEVYIY